MRAITYQDVGEVAITDVAEPEITNSNEVVVRVALTGICGTDHKIVAGKLQVADRGTVLGHEGVGTVVAIGADVDTLEPGDRVVLNPTQSCLRCTPCRLGKYCYCTNFDDHQVGFSLPGTFAPLVKSPARWLYRIPEGMSWETASLAEPFGCSLNTIVKAAIQPWESVLVIGAGPIGMMCLTLASNDAAVVVSSEPADFRREFAARVANAALHPDQLTTESVSRIVGQDGFDVVIDAVGNQGATALHWLAKGGRFVPMGYDDTYRMDLSTTKMIDDGLSIVASVPVHDAVGPALQLLGKYPSLEHLVTDIVDFDEYHLAFAATMGRDPVSGRRVPISAMKGVVRS